MISGNGCDGFVRIVLPSLVLQTVVALFVLTGCASHGLVEGDPAGALRAGSPGHASTYQLSVGDEVSVQVFREPDLSGSFSVESGGVIRHPLLGPLPLAGRTVREAEAYVHDLLAERFLVNPRVTLRVISSQAAQIVVLGEVKKPGVHGIPFDEPLTLLQIIGTVGGFTDLASINRVRIIREEEGRQHEMRVRVSRILSGQDPDVPVKPNDVILVPQSFF